MVQKRVPADQIIKVERSGKTYFFGEKCRQPNENGVQTAVWRYLCTKDGEPSDYVDIAEGVPMGEVWRELVKRLEAEELTDESFSIHPAWIYTHGEHAREELGNSRSPRRYEVAEFPVGYRWIASYAVTGTSEGWYVHTTAVYQREDDEGDYERHNPLFLGKTFKGMEHAYALARRVAELLGA